MKNTAKKALALAGSLVALSAASSQAHTVALGWEVLPNGDVTFYDAHWHGAINDTQNTGLFIDNVEYKFTGIDNDVDSRTGLDGAIFNPDYYSYDPVLGTLTADPVEDYNDWLTVTVSNLPAGTHTFGTTNIALTQWDIPSNSGGTVTVVLPPPPTPNAPTIPEPSQSLTLLGLLASGLVFGRRRQA